MGDPRAEPAPSSAVLASASANTVGASVDLQSIQDPRVLNREALRIEIKTPRTHKQSVDVFRVGARQVDANPDEISFTGPFFEVSVSWA